MMREEDNAESVTVIVKTARYCEHCVAITTVTSTAITAVTLPQNPYY
jgi:hypothetical protein